MKKTKLYKILNSLLIILFAVVAFYFLFSLIAEKTELILPYLSFESLEGRYYLLIGAILLLFLNWFLEGLKWSRLISVYFSISSKNVIKSLLAGISMGLFTPNRIGEIGGRSLYVSNVEKPKVLYLSTISSISQLLLTLLMGLIGLNFYFEEFSTYLLLKKDVFIYLSILIVMILLLGFFKMQHFRRMHSYIFPFIKKKVMQLPKVSPSSKLQLLFWSFLRYQVFALQFYMLMLCFTNDVDFISLYFALSIVYLLSAVIPSSALTEMPIRISLSYFIFDLLSMNAEIALIASVSMWVINLFVPALVGIYLLKDIKLFPFNKALPVK